MYITYVIMFIVVKKQIRPNQQYNTVKIRDALKPVFIKIHNYMTGIKYSDRAKARPVTRQR